MFESFYGLNANPFRLSADAQFRYAHKSYVKAWSYLKYALEQAEGFVLITGRPGTGKTTLVRDILSDQDESKLMAVTLVTNQFQSEELLRAVALAFGFQANDYNKATLLTRISDYATQLHDAGRRVIILVDEAQNLTENGLEELRLLSNLQIGNKPLFQIFLIGQEETRNLIYGRGLKNIQQRILAACRLEPMDDRYVENYIEHRLGIVGWDHDPELEPEIFPLIHKLTQGVPREVNHLMSRLLLYGALEEKHRLTDEDLWIVVKELDGEHRLGIDVQAAWASYEQEKGLASDDTKPHKDAGSSDRSEDDTETHGQEAADLSPSNPSVIHKTEVTESVVFGTDEDSTEVDFFGPPMLQDIWQAGEGAASDVQAHGQEEKADPLDDLPSMRADDVFDLQSHPRLLADVEDLLDDERDGPSPWRKRWRWLFYPMLIILLLVSLLVPRPSDLPAIGKTLWRTVLGQKTAEPAHPAEKQDVESAQQPQVEKTEIYRESAPVQAPVSTEEVQELPTITPARKEEAGDLPQTTETPPPVESRQVTGKAIRIEMDKDYLIYLDENGTGPAPDSLALVTSAIDALVHDRRMLIVITGLNQGIEYPIEGMRQALHQAESLTDYLVAYGASRAQISIEGSVQEYAISARAGGMSDPLDTGPSRVRLKLTRLQVE